MVYWDSETGEIAGDGTSREVFSADYSTSQLVRITTNETSDAYIQGGDKVLWKHNVSTFVNEMTIANPDGSNPVVLVSLVGTYQNAFDGERWVVLSQVQSPYDRLVRYDLQNLAAGGEAYKEEAGYGGGAGVAFNGQTGMLYIGGADLHFWNMNTGQRGLLVTDPGSQVFPDADGHAIVYISSEQTGDNWWGNGQIGDIRLRDLETGVTRMVFPMMKHYAPGITERWMVVNQVGPYGDALILCDLVEAGFMDESLHVCPEWGCEPPDTDSDTGTETGSDGEADGGA